jgi:hypothetical protein
MCGPNSKFVTLSVACLLAVYLIFIKEDDPVEVMWGSEWVPGKFLHVSVKTYVITRGPRKGQVCVLHIFG